MIPERYQLSQILGVLRQQPHRRNLRFSLSQNIGAELSDFAITFATSDI